MMSLLVSLAAEGAHGDELPQGVFAGVLPFALCKPFYPCKKKIPTRRGGLGRLQVHHLK
jgi:hypothetical protein